MPYLLENSHLIHQKTFQLPLPQFVKVDHLYGYRFTIDVIASSVDIARVSAAKNLAERVMIVFDANPVRAQAISRWLAVRVHYYAFAR